MIVFFFFFFFSSRRRHTRLVSDWSSDVCSSDLGHHSPLHRHKCEEVYYVVKGSGEIEVDGERHAFGPGSAIFNRPQTVHRVWNTGDETVQLVVVAGVMLVPLWPQ